MAIDLTEIMTRANTLKEFWQPRNLRILEWLDLENLIDANAAKGSESYVTNEPMVMMSLAVHLLTGNPIQHRVITLNQADGKKGGESERFLTSIWRDINERHALSGNGISWDKAFAYWMCQTGWYAIAARTESANSDPVFIADLLNPMNVYPQYTSQHTQAVAHYYRTTVQDAREKAELWGTSIGKSADGKKPDDPLTIIDYWWKPSLAANSHNTVFILDNRDPILPIHESPYFDIPIYTGPVGGLPFRGYHEQDSRTWQENAGRSILEPNRQTLKQFNRWMSFLSELARQAPQAPLILSGANITQQQLKRPIREGSAIISALSKDFRAQRLDPSRFPLELQSVINVLQGETQRGGFPYVLYGGANIDLSGFAINQLLSAATKLIGAQKEAMARILSQLDKMFLESYRKFDYNSITIQGKTTDRRPDWFMEEFSADRIPQKIFIEAEVKIDLPSDLLNRVTIMRQALGNNLPMVDMLTGLEEILKLDDPYGVMERMKQDGAEYSEEARRIRVYQGMMENARQLREVGGRINIESAEVLEQFATFMLSQAAAQVQQGAGGGAAPRTQGLSPEQQPPEASGRSPDVMRALLGLQPAGANR